MIAINELILKENGFTPLPEFIRSEGITRRTAENRFKRGEYIRVYDPAIRRYYYKSLLDRGPISLKQACFRLGISEATIRRYVADGRMKARSTNPITFDEEGIQDYLCDIVKRLKYQ